MKIEYSKGNAGVFYMDTKTFYHKYNDRYYFNELLVLICGLLLFCLLIKIGARAEKIGGWANIVAFAALVFLCLIFRGPASREIAKATCIVVRIIGPLLGVYALLAGITYPAGVTERTDMLLTASNIIAIVGAVGAVVAFKYPMFILLPCASVLAQKSLGNEFYGVVISATDYIAVVEIGLFIGSVLFFCGKNSEKIPFKIGEIIRAAEIEKTTTLLFTSAVAIHFSNYFYSGVTKLLLEGGPLLWVLKNPTELLTLNAWLGGFLPAGQFTHTSVVMAEWATTMRPLLNVSILLAQLGSVICLLRRRSMIIVTLFYDVTHVAIFLLSGIFFWKWIILNLALVAAMRKLPRWVEAPIPVILGVVMVVMAPDFFHIARLAWYDTPAFTRSEIFAVTKEGRQIKVPSNYFGNISVTVAQHRLGRVVPGHYPTVTWGTTQSLEVFRGALDNCSFEKDELVNFRSDKNRITNIVQLTHAYALSQARSNGTYHYNRFPHHIWSNLWMYDEFANLSLGQIERYVYRTTSECVSFGEFGPVVREDFRDEFVIPVDDTVSVLRSLKLQP